MVVITQEGNLSAPLTNGLFQDLSFWVSLTVPGQSKIIDLIKKNGGTVTRAERDATYLLVNHEKPPLRNHLHDPKISVFSYRFVLDSVASSRLQDESEYIVSLDVASVTKTTSTKNRTKSTAKPVGLPKRAKVMFTLEDDLILLRKLSQPGTKLSGYKVYEELADEYPSHTVHGWRGRWVDHFSKLEPGTPEGWLRELSGDIEEERWDEEGEEEEGEEEEGEEEEEEGGEVVVDDESEELEQDEPLDVEFEEQEALSTIPGPRKSLDKGKAKSIDQGQSRQYQRSAQPSSRQTTKARISEPIGRQPDTKKIRTIRPDARQVSRTRLSEPILPSPRPQTSVPVQSITGSASSAPHRKPNLIRKTSPNRENGDHQAAMKRGAAPSSSAPIRRVESEPQLQNFQRKTLPLASPSPRKSLPVRPEASISPRKSLPSVPSSRPQPSVPSRKSSLDAPPSYSQPQHHISSSTPEKYKRKVRISDFVDEIPATPTRGDNPHKRQRKEASPELSLSTESRASLQEDSDNEPLHYDEEELEAMDDSETHIPLYKPTAMGSNQTPPSNQQAVYPPSSRETTPPPDSLLDPLPLPFLSPESEYDSSTDDPLADIAMLRRKYPTLTERCFWWAVEKTGNDRDLTLEVVKEWMEHKRLLDHPRVWTMADDLAVRGSDVRAIEDVIERRGEKEFDRWMTWLNSKAKIIAEREADKKLRNGNGRRSE